VNLVLKEELETLGYLERLVNAVSLVKLVLTELTVLEETKVTLVKKETALRDLLVKREKRRNSRLLLLALRNLLAQLDPQDQKETRVTMVCLGHLEQSEILACLDYSERRERKVFLAHPDREVEMDHSDQQDQLAKRVTSV